MFSSIDVITNLNKDKDMLTLQVGETTYTLSTAEVETLIVALANQRANMLPPVPITLPQPQDNLPKLTYLEAEKNLDTGSCEFRFRSQAYGWHTIQMSPEWVAGFTDYLNGKGWSAPEGASIN